MERTCSWGILIILCILFGLPLAAIIQKKKGVSFWRAIFQGASIIFVILLVIGLILVVFDWI